MDYGWLWLIIAIACGALAGVLMDRWLEAKGK